MMLLSGLLGMLTLGTLALVSTGPDPEDDEDETLDDSLEEGDGQTTSLLDLDLDPPDMPDDAPDSGQAGTDPTTLSPVTAPQTVLPLAEVGIAPAPDQGFVSYTGSGDADLYFGTDEDELIFGDDGGDTMLGEGGNDTLHGQQGADDLYGGADNDVLFGGLGQDTLTGDEGADILRGDQGSDALHGREGDDTLEGGLGTDTLFGAAGNDLLIGTEFDADGADLDGKDYLNAGAGDDTVIAGDEDIVSLGAGADVLYLGDWMTGPGAEVLDFDETEDQLMVVYNDSEHSGEPEVTMRLNADDPTLTEITLGDEVLATLPTEDAPTLDDIVLIAESSLVDLNIGVLSARAG
ncbi:calcium-binding protein [Antarctobacter jejuensis]|uniref:calcium-binding protein n=1 Tax=Antarctobacter jejuensis TaxID=1439938 RepID=UPI003FD0E3EA